MRIALGKPYKSIATLETDELPDLAMLIGRNGVGKTHLLEALKGYVAEIQGFGRGEIQLYDMDSFRPSNTKSANRQTSQFAHSTANAYLMTPHDGQLLISTAAAIFDDLTSDIERNSGVQARNDFESNLRSDVQQMNDFAVFAEKDRECPYKRKLNEQVLTPLSAALDRRSSTHSSNSFNGNPAALVSAAMKLNRKLPHELTRDDIIRASHYDGDTIETISNSISTVFTTYKLDQFYWAHRRIETENIAFAELINRYRSKSPPPWEALREILSAMRSAAGDDGLFDFDFSDPESHHLGLDNCEQFSFKAEMTNRTTGARYELDSLSSGERILMGLCLASFNHQYLGRRPPRLLLLDELDAVLHPSMVSALVETLKTLFVSKGTRVLMTSHSPMSVAALEESSIFRVARTGGHVEISRTSKAEAINELSEGLATVDMGLRIAAYDDARVTILTEGQNAKHLKRWVELNFPEGVRVFEGLERHSNNKQLLMYGRLLAKMNTNTHFVIVWDCDSANQASILRSELPVDAKITPYAFANRLDNTITPKGIENNYDEDILEEYSTKTTRSDGTVLSRGFQNNRKTEFADHVLREGTPQYFTNFQCLHNIVIGILEPMEEP